MWLQFGPGYIVCGCMLSDNFCKVRSGGMFHVALLRILQANMCHVTKANAPSWGRALASAGTEFLFFLVGKIMTKASAMSQVDVPLATTWMS